MQRDDDAEGCTGIRGPLRADPGCLNIVALSRGGENYVIVYSDRWTGEAYRTLGRWAHNPELSFDWHDAAKLVGKIRENAGVEA